MAITYKDTNGWVLVKQLGVTPESIAKMQGQGFEASLVKGSQTHLNFTLHGKFIGTLPLKSTYLLALKTKALAPSIMSMLQSSLQTYITQAGGSPVVFEAKWADATVTKDASGMGISKSKSVLAAVPPIETAKTEAPLNIWPEFPADQVSKAPVVQLRNATQMYQPVRGTSSSSRYYMVGANADLRIAARYNGSSLSVRIEGPGFNKYTKAMTAAGFSKVSPEEKYSSLHLNVGTDVVVASKALGAILMGLGVQLQTPLPQLSKFPKGN